MIEPDRVTSHLLTRLLRRALLLWWRGWRCAVPVLLVAVVAVMVAAVLLVLVTMRRKKTECKRFEVEKTIGVCDVGNRCQITPPPLDLVHPYKVSLNGLRLSGITTPSSGSLMSSP